MEKIELGALSEVIRPRPPYMIYNASAPARRIIFVDGCNFLSGIGDKMDDLEYNTGKPNARFVLVLAYKLLKMGFEVIIGMKAYHMDEKNTHRGYVLNQLHEAGIIHVFEDSIDDDEELLSEAQRLGGILISNDQFKEEKYSNYKDVPTVRFSFDNNGHVDDQQYFTFDGRFATRLQIYLHTTLQEFEEMTTCDPGDPKFQTVKYMEITQNVDYFDKAIEQCEILADFYRLKIASVVASQFRYMSSSRRIVSPPYFDYYKEEGKIPSRFSEFYSAFRCHVPGLSFPDLPNLRNDVPAQ